MINATLGVETVRCELEGYRPQHQRRMKRKRRQPAKDTELESEGPKTDGSSHQQQYRQPPKALAASTAPDAVPYPTESLDSDREMSRGLGPRHPVKAIKSSGSVADDSHTATNCKRRKQDNPESALLTHTMTEPPAPEPPMPRPPIPRPIPITDSSGNVHALMAVQNPLSTTANISPTFDPADDPEYDSSRQAPKVHLLPPTFPCIDGRASPDSPLDLPSPHSFPPANPNLNWGFEGTHDHPAGPSLFNFDVMSFSMVDHPDMVEPSLFTPTVMTPTLSLDSSSNSQDGWGVAGLFSHEEPEEATEMGLGDYSY